MAYRVTYLIGLHLYLAKSEHSRLGSNPLRNVFIIAALVYILLYSEHPRRHQETPMPFAHPHYVPVTQYLESIFQPISGLDLYPEMFPENQPCCPSGSDPSYDHPNAVFLYHDEARLEGMDTESMSSYSREKMALAPWVMFRDTWAHDYDRKVVGRPAICSGLSYVGKHPTYSRAHALNALVFDLDNVDEKMASNVVLLSTREDIVEHMKIPRPTYIAVSGSGLHLYYVMDEPIEFSPFDSGRIRQLNTWKEALTKRLWTPNTSLSETRQYQGIAQPFRMVGSMNPKYGTTVQGFRSGERVSVEYLNSFLSSPTYAYAQYHRDRFYQADRKAAKSLKELQDDPPEWFADWYHERVIQGIPAKGGWKTHRALYDRYVERAAEIKGGHRYNYLYCMAAMAVKCEIDRAEFEADVDKAFVILKDAAHDHPLEQADADDAKRAYDDRGLKRMTRAMVERRTGLSWNPLPRKGVPLQDHIALVNMKMDYLRKTQGSDPRGRPAKVPIAKEFIAQRTIDIALGKAEGPIRAIDVMRAVGCSRPTANKAMREMDESLLPSYSKKEVVKEWVEKAVENGEEVTHARCAQEIGVTEGTALKWFRDLGIEEETPHQREVRLWREANPTGTKMSCAKDTGFSWNTVNKHWDRGAPSA